MEYIRRLGYMGDDVKIKYSFWLLLLTMVLVVTSEALAGGPGCCGSGVERFGNPKDNNWGTHTREWGVIDGFSTEKECRQRIEERIKKMTNPNYLPKDDYTMYKVTGNTITFLFYDKDTKPNESGKMRGMQIMHHACLPDTVDPREPSQRK